MKRSDAIKLIGSILVFGREGMPRDKYTNYEGYSLADIILTELEENGMKPPDTGKNHHSGIWFGPDHNWDPED
jgi:hypothetical protein